MANSTEQGTGKHPHKSSEDPRPHHEAASSKEGKSGSEESRSSQSNGGDSSDLKSREYKDAQGNVHHHTHSYEEQHKK